MVETIIQGLNEYFKNSPIIPELKKIKVDYLSEKDGSFSIEPIPVKPIISKSIDHSVSECQYAFYIAGKFMYSEEAMMNLNNSGLIEKLERWIDEQNNNDNLPILPGGMFATSLEVVSSGFLYGVTDDLQHARYQIQLRLLYDKKENV